MKFGITGVGTGGKNLFLFLNIRIQKKKCHKVNSLFQDCKYNGNSDEPIFLKAAFYVFWKTGKTLNKKQRIDYTNDDRNHLISL